MDLKDMGTGGIKSSSVNKMVIVSVFFFCVSPPPHFPSDVSAWSAKTSRRGDGEPDAEGYATYKYTEKRFCFNVYI